MIIESTAITAAASIDTIFIGFAAGFCPCYKKNKYKIIYAAAAVSIVHFFMFLSGYLLSFFKYSFTNAENINLFPYIFLIIILKLGFDVFFRKTENTDEIKISFFLILISGIDSAGAGLSISKNYFLYFLFIAIILNFLFTITGFYASRISMDRILFLKIKNKT
jgi:hypothetical protein